MFILICVEGLCLLLRDDLDRLEREELVPFHEARLAHASSELFRGLADPEDIDAFLEVMCGRPLPLYFSSASSFSQYDYS